MTREAHLIESFVLARRSPRLCVIEGFHALKHALIFGAPIQTIVTDDANFVRSLQETIGYTDSRMLDTARVVSPEIFVRLTPKPCRTHILAIAKRQKYHSLQIEHGPVIALDQPRDLQNIGAVIRVGAAAGAVAVVVIDGPDVWLPDIVRTSAGLHYALQVHNISDADMDVLPRPWIALDDSGITTPRPTRHGTYIFGSERTGIRPEIAAQCDHIYRLEMQPGVSSLNLATAVSATMYQM